MVLISHRYKFIHLRNTKVASSSVESFFGQFCVDPAEPYEFKDFREEIVSSYGIIGNKVGGSWASHMNAKDIKEKMGDELFTTYIKFCVVRNPYDWMVSAYHWIKRGDREHSDFKKMIGFTLCAYPKNIDRILLYGQPICDYYLRYENLKEDMVMLLDKLGITEYNIEDLPNFKSDTRPKGIPYQDYYDEETRAMVANIFKTEIEMFGYTF